MKFVGIILLILSSATYANKRECMDFYPILKIDGLPEWTEAGLQDHAIWLNKVEFVLKQHKVWYHRFSENEMCVPAHMVRSGEIKKYEEMARSENWLRAHGYK